MLLHRLQHYWPVVHNIFISNVYLHNIVVNHLCTAYAAWCNIHSMKAGKRKICNIFCSWRLRASGVSSGANLIV